jgi:hypothetical protein
MQYMHGIIHYKACRICMSISDIEMHTAMLLKANGAGTADAYVNYTLRQQPVQLNRMTRSCR